MLEVQKLAWFIARGAPEVNVPDPLGLDFKAHWYGPYSDSLRLLLNSLDGSYLYCEKRLADADPESEIWFNPERKDFLAAYLQSQGRRYGPLADWTTSLIRGFESPLGMELLATVDWLLQKEAAAPHVAAVKAGIGSWGPAGAGRRKRRIFDDRMIRIALDRLTGDKECESPTSA